MTTIKYKRVLLKLSGESFSGSAGFGIDSSTLIKVSRQIKQVVEMGVGVGIVVGASDDKQAQSLRLQYPHLNILVPGYGAQGATAADCVAFCKEDGSGALINASRSIIYAHENEKYTEQFGDDWEKCIEQACLDMKTDIVLSQRGQQAI